MNFSIVTAHLQELGRWTFDISDLFKKENENYKHRHGVVSVLGISGKSLHCQHFVSVRDMKIVTEDEFALCGFSQTSFSQRVCVAVCISY